MTAQAPVHQQSFPLPRSAFLHDRRGPWPQPAPDHPMGMAAEVLHPAKSDDQDWNRTAGMNYLKALVTKLPLALYNWFIHYRIDHIGDREFASLLESTNYSKYLKLKTVEQLADSDFAARLGPLAADRQYLVATFTPIQDVVPYPGIHVAPTLVLLSRPMPQPASGPRKFPPCEVLAISIGHLEQQRWKQVVVTPVDSHAWVLAKYFALQGGAHIVALTGHPATHFPYDTVNAVTQSSVPMHHTLFQLLQPHLRLHLSVDHAVLEGGNSVVSESRGTFYAPFAGPSDSVRNLVAAGYLGYPNRLSTYTRNEPPATGIPAWSYANAVHDVPSDYGSFLKAYHQSIRRFVRTVVATIHSEEEHYYIRRWAQYIADWLPGFPNGEQIMERDAHGDPKLVDAVTTYIWDVAIAHSLEHRSFGAIGPHRTSFRVRVPPPDSTGAPAYRRSQILSGWDMFKSTLAFEMFFKPHNVELLKDVRYAFTDPLLIAAASQFKTDLAATERELVAAGIDVTQYATLDQMSCSIQY